jgi:hypothetical protein
MEFPPINVMAVMGMRFSFSYPDPFGIQYNLFKGEF